MSSPSAPASVGSYVTLGVGGETFAIDVALVREILDWRPVSHLPYAPPFLVGVIDVRDCTVPVIDLRIKLGLPPTPPTENTRILVLEVDLGERPLVLGLMADRVYEVAEFAATALGAAPDVGVQWNSQYIKALGRLRGEFVIIFDMEKLFTTTEVASFETVA
jgi:purine-binding chemotaxis protein CheW